MTVRILHLVDLPERSRTTESALRASMSLVYDPVKTAGEYIEALERRVYDLVLASASCSSYDGMEAFSYLRQHYPEIPFVFLTTPKEKAALLDIPRMDAWDVVSTSELKRLPLSVAHAIDAATCSGELAKAKSLLLRSERSITIGRLLGSIAHEINNPLEAIANLLYLAQKSSDSGGESLSKWLRMAEQELQRVGEITKQTLAFHRDSQNAQDVRVTEALDSVLVLYRSKLERRKIEVVRQYRSAGVLRGFFGELRQVFANFIANAIDAMPNGGQLILRVREQTGPNPKLFITFADTGSGMSREGSRRMGELFYTTKGESGTGLGMWVSQQILRKYGGSLRAFSSTRTGRSGTIFRLRFSISPESVKTASDSSFQAEVLQSQASEDERREDEPGTGGELAKSA
jgi:signal transduction histidine kinase